VDPVQRNFRGSWKASRKSGNWDDSHVHWHAEVWGKDKEWDAEITEHEPDKRISWKSVSGADERGHRAI
jgi:uncharacterized membrane protein